MLLLGALLPAGLRAQATPVRGDIDVMHARLHQQAAELLQRSGDTFYALGGLVLDDGSYEAFGPDHWPDLQAPPAEWRESLAVAFRQADRPIRAAAMLIDLGRSWDPPPATTAVTFHAETATRCEESEEAFRAGDNGRIAWGAATSKPCRRELLGVAPFAESALFTPDGILFASPVPLPWDSLLPAGLRATALAADPARRHRLFADRNDYGGTEVPFPISLPPVLASRFYYLLDSVGVRELHPAGLRGAAWVTWSGTRDSVSAVTASGNLQVPGGPASGGGLVFIADDPRSLAVEPSDMTADALLAPHGGTYLGQGTPFRRMLSQHAIRQRSPGADRWIWVQWAPDSAMVEGGCMLRLELFHLTPDPVEVASLDAQCDV